MTTRRYEVVQRMPNYRMEFDMVAEAPDGSLAAFCIVWWDAEKTESACLSRWVAIPPIASVALPAR